MGRGGRNHPYLRSAINPTIIHRGMKFYLHGSWFYHVHGAVEIIKQEVVALAALEPCD